MKTLAPTLQNISAERIQVELVKMLVSDRPELLRTAYELGITAQFLPEFDELMKTEQETPHHMYNVGEHTLHAMQNIRSDKVLRLKMPKAWRILKIMPSKVRRLQKRCLRD